MNKLLKQKCGDKRILSKYFALFDKNFQKYILVGLLNAPKLFFVTRNQA